MQVITEITFNSGKEVTIIREITPQDMQKERLTVKQIQKYVEDMNELVYTLFQEDKPGAIKFETGEVVKLSQVALFSVKLVPDSF